MTTAGMDQAAALAAARTEAEAEATGTASCTEAAAKPMRAISIVSCMLMLAAASLLVKMIFAVVHTVDDTEIKPPYAPYSVSVGTAGELWPPASHSLSLPWLVHSS